MWNSDLRHLLYVNHLKVYDSWGIQSNEGLDCGFLGSDVEYACRLLQLSGSEYVGFRFTSVV